MLALSGHRVLLDLVTLVLLRDRKACSAKEESEVLSRSWKSEGSWCTLGDFLGRQDRGVSSPRAGVG